MLLQPQKQVLLLVLMRKPFVNGAMNFMRVMVAFQNQKVASMVVHMFLMMRIAEKSSVLASLQCIQEGKTFA